MAYDANKPADDQYIALGPGDIRTNLEGLITGRNVDAQKIMGYSPGNGSGNIPLNNGMVNTNLNADTLDGSHAADFAGVNHDHDDATTSTDGFMSNTDKAKLDGVASGAEVNQNAFYDFIVRNAGLFYHIFATSKTDSVQLLDGANITITPDTVNKTITFAVSGTVPAASGAAYAANADTVDGLHAAAFAAASHTTHTGEASSIAATGYKKFADGMIINWGLVTDIPANSGNKSLTFALAFPNNWFSIALASGDNGGFYGAAIEYYTPSKSGVVLVNRSTAIKSCYVIAIGN